MKIPRRLKEMLSVLSAQPNVTHEKRGLVLTHPDGTAKMTVNLGTIQTPLQWDELGATLRQTFGRKK